MGLEIAVVGGSLGGLTAACLLRDGGHDVTVYERSPVPLEERGAGIGFLETTGRYLAERVGIDPDDLSVETGSIRYLARDGSVADEAAHRYRFSSWNTVYRHLLDHWTGGGPPEGPSGDDRYRLDHEVVDLTQDADGVELAFADGSRRRAAVAVMADGIGSRGREIVAPSAVRSYAGYVGWRGMVAEAALDPATARRFGDAITYYVYANSHILVYPIPGTDGCLEPGHRLVNVVWYRNYAEGDPDLIFGLYRPGH